MNLMIWRNMKMNNNIFDSIKAMTDISKVSKTFVCSFKERKNKLLSVGPIILIASVMTGDRSISEKYTECLNLADESINAAKEISDKTITLMQREISVLPVYEELFAKLDMLKDKIESDDAMKNFDALDPSIRDDILTRLSENENNKEEYEDE